MKLRDHVVRDSRLDGQRRQQDDVARFGLVSRLREVRRLLGVAVYGWVWGVLQVASVRDWVVTSTKPFIPMPFT